MVSIRVKLRLGFGLGLGIRVTGLVFGNRVKTTRVRVRD